MAKRKIMKKSKSRLFVFLVALAALLVLSVLLPVVFPNATGLLKTVIDFFVLVRDHFKEFWMVYSFSLLIVLAYFSKKK
jgi:hypothetical protein